MQPEWLGYANTAKAQSKIRALLRRNERETRAKGEDLLRKFLQEHDIELNSAVINKLCRLHEISTRDSLMLAIGEKNIQLSENDVNYLLDKQKKTSTWRKFIPFMSDKSKGSEQDKLRKLFVRNIDRKKTFILNEDTMRSCKIAACCHPIPGDDSLGYIDPNDEFTIHKRECPVAEKLKSNYGNRIVAVEWQMHHMMLFPVTIYVKGIDVQGMLLAISEVIYKQLNLDVKQLNISTKDGIFEGNIVVNVHDTTEVREICNALLTIKDIVKVVRIN